MSEFDDIAELMSEPPGGHNHGRKRGAGGRWTVLGTKEHQVTDDDLWAGEIQPAYRRPEKPVETIRHGTAAAYQNDRCRCPDCTDAWAAYKRERRRQNG